MLSSRPTIDFISPSFLYNEGLGWEFKKSYTITLLLHYFQKSIHRGVAKIFFLKIVAYWIENFPEKSVIVSCVRFEKRKNEYMVHSCMVRGK